MLGTERERLAELEARYPVWENHTLWTRFCISAEQFSQQEYVAFETEVYTYAEVFEHVNEVARSLYSLGVRPGDHVAVLLSNCAEFVFLTYALAKMGAVKIPINAVISQTELTHELNQADARFFISKFLPDEAVMQKLPRIKKMVILDANPLYSPKYFIYWDEFLKLADLVPEEEVNMISAACQNPDGLADIMFTSGSTSKSKGVMLTHDMLLRSAFANCYTRCFESGRRMFAPLPLFHAYSYVEGLLALQYVGGTIIMTKSKFTPQNALRILRDFRANDMILIGSLVIKMLLEGDPKPEDYPHLHAGYWCVSTPDWSWEAARKAFGIQDITTGTGMTELSSSGCMTSPTSPPDHVMKHDGAPKRAGCAGVQEYNGCILTLKICDQETGEELPPNTEGEIYYRGISVTRGYYNDLEATQRAFTADGWLKSGDLGILSADGCLKYVGRKNDMYKINGENVSPMFLDSVIGNCPLVNTAETVGVSHPKYGEVGVAFIDAKDTSEEGRQEIQKYCKDKLAKFQVPKYYFYSDSDTWPRTGTGKITKTQLRCYAEKLLENTGG